MLFSAVAAEVIDELFNIHADSVAAKMEDDDEEEEDDDKDEDEDDAESVATLPPGDISKSFSDVVNGWCFLHCTHFITKAPPAVTCNTPPSPSFLPSYTPCWKEQDGVKG